MKFRPTQAEGDVIRLVWSNPDCQQATQAFVGKDQYSVIFLRFWHYDVEYGDGDHLFAPVLLGSGWSRLPFGESGTQLVAQLAAGLMQTAFDGGHTDLEESGDLAHAQLLEVVEEGRRRGWAVTTVRWPPG